MDVLAICLFASCFCFLTFDILDGSALKWGSHISYIGRYLFVGLLMFVDIGCDL